jgi:hypothetical protein
MLHTRSFAQNSFQIDSINSGSTSKKLEFRLIIVRITYFLTLKPINTLLGIIFEVKKKIARWCHKSEISKRNVKNMIFSTIIQLLGMAWVSKEAVWSVHLICLGCCFSAKFEQTLKIS